MRKERRVEFVVGIFLIAAIAIVMFLIVRMGGRLFVREYEVSAYFQDAAGLSPGVTVALAGVPVGEVKNLQLLSPQQVEKLGRTGTLVRVDLTIDRKFNIPVDSRLVLTRTALLGEASLVFIATNTMRYLPKDGTAIVWNTQLPPGPTEKLEQVVVELQASFDRLIGNINGIIGDEQFQKNLKAMVSNMADTSERSKAVADQAKATLESTQKLLISARGIVEGEEVKSIIKRAESLVTSLDTGISSEKLQETLASINKSAESFGKVADQVKLMLEKERGLLATLLKDEKFAEEVKEVVRGLRADTLRLEQTLPALAAAAEQIRSLGEFLGRHPSAIIFGRPGSAPAPYAPPLIPAE